MAAALAALVFAALGYSASEFISHATGAAGATNATGAAAKPQPTRPTKTAVAPTAATTTQTPQPSQAQAPHPTPGTIVPVSVVAFGPDGTPDGDDPQNAARVLTDPTDGWLSRWYTTADFGRLQAGTGLLLDMGRTLTLTSVQVTLGSPPGTNVQLRLGAVPSLAALQVAGTETATAAGQTLNLRPAAPVRARYVLLWFTSLPPDGAGTYQVFVHQVTVDGQP